MTTDYTKIDFHKFVDDELASNGFRIMNITAELMEKRLEDFMNFVNGIRLEYKDLYGWSAEPREYFLNGMVDKWKYSLVILNQKDEICFLNLSSVYGDILHNHCSYAGKNTRNHNLAKLHMIKVSELGLENGFAYQGGYWPKKNNGSIILYLKMGWEIESMRNDKELFLKGDLLKVRNRTYEILTSNKDPRE